MAQKSIRLYLDEDVRPLLAEILRSRGYDAVSSVERGQIGAIDEQQMLISIKEERVILTHNVRDFVKLHYKFNDVHSGIIVSNQIPFKVLLRRVLKLLSSLSPEDVKGSLIWLGDFE